MIKHIIPVRFKISINTRKYVATYRGSDNSGKTGWSSFPLETLNIDKTA